MIAKKDLDILKKAWIITLIALFSIIFLEKINPFFSKNIDAANLGIQNILIDQFSTNRLTNSNVVVVKIDDETLADRDNESPSDAGWLGRWQDFKRSYYATVIDHLKRDGAAVIGLDVLFSEKSTETEDTALSESINRAGNVILGFSLGKKNNQKNEKWVYPIKTLVGAGLGYFDPILYSNNLVYSFQPVDSIFNPKYEGFSFAITRKYFDFKNDNRITPLDKHSTEIQWYYLVTNNKNGKKLYAPFVSDDINEWIYINYAPKSANFQELSFADVYHDNGNYKGVSVKNKIVLIGATALGLHDEFYTPKWTMQGVFLHANMINTLLNEKFLTKVDMSKEIFFLIILTFMLVFFILKINSKIIQMIIVIIMIIIMTAFEWLCFVWFGKLFNYPAELIILVLWITIGTTLYKYFYEEKWKRALKWALSQYLSEELVVNILDKFEEVKLDGKRMNITSFFSDIAWFTSISENMEPEELVHFLSIYLKEVSDIIMQEKGFINKYEWDAVMALWWAFGWNEAEQTILACRAALRQQEKIQELNKEFMKNQGIEISVRMGINKWVAVVGNIGSVGKKIEYTALGDSVNTASRFEGINKLYGTLICVGESVAEEAKEFFVFRKLDSIQVKWKEKPVFIYELVGEVGKVTKSQLQLITEFEKALALYTIGDVIEWKEIFKKLHEDHGDAPSLTFLNRCGKLIEEGVPAGWQWVYRATEK